MQRHFQVRIIGADHVRDKSRCRRKLGDVDAEVRQGIRLPHVQYLTRAFAHRA
jgi:hypothetical protein